MNVPRLAPELADALAATPPSRVLALEQAGRLIGASRQTVDKWCRATPPLPHDDRPGRRPAVLVSERELLAHALGEPGWHEAARARIRQHVPERSPRNSPSPGPREETPPAHEPRPQTSPRLSPTGPPEDEVARLRAEVVALRERVARLLIIVEEQQDSEQRKNTQWLALLREGVTPGDLADVDGLP